MRQDAAIFAALEEIDPPPFTKEDYWASRIGRGQDWRFYRWRGVAIAVRVDDLNATSPRFEVYHQDRLVIIRDDHRRPFETLQAAEAWIASEINNEVDRCTRNVRAAEAELAKHEQFLAKAHGVLQAF